MPKGIAHSRKRRLLHGIETPLRTGCQRRWTRILARAKEHAPDASSPMARIERQQGPPKM
jgi:hypothetical protein